VGQPFESAVRLVGAPLAADKLLLAADEQGTLLGLDQNDPGAVLRRWTLGGIPTSGPFAHGGQALVIVDERKLALVDPAVAAEGESTAPLTPQWTSKPCDGPICGLPVSLGDTLLITDAGGSIWVLRTSDGRPARRVVSLGGSLAPSAAAVPFGPEQVLVPLADGTLIVETLPPLQPAELAEAGR
jgi:hypothetical protein